MKEIPKAVGENGSFQHSINKIEEKLYFDCGRYITWSLMHGGPSCKLLSKVTVEMLFGNYSNLSISDVNDMESKTCLLKVFLISSVKTELKTKNLYLLPIQIIVTKEKF